MCFIVVGPPVRVKVVTEKGGSSNASKPMQVSQAQYETNWNLAFGKDLSNWQPAPGSKPN